MGCANKTAANSGKTNGSRLKAGFKSAGLCGEKSTFVSSQITTLHFGRRIACFIPSEAVARLAAMPEFVPQELIERAHASGVQLLLSITGGGSRAISTLLEVPGATASVLGAIVPYARAALESWLGGPVDHYCSERTARAMAMAAFERARQFSEEEPSRQRGIGATASLATLRPKRGPHRIHVAWQSADKTVAFSCQLAKGERTRAQEEAIAALLILMAVFEACGVQAASLLDSAVAADVHRREKQAPAAWSELLLGKRRAVAFGDSPSQAESTKPAILFPGAFNPLHSGHEQMAQVAADRFSAPVTFEISVTNVDKPPLDFIEIADRLEQLANRQVLLTRAATFVEKARLAPSCTFIVGADTLVRVAEPRYYGGDTARRDAAIEAIAEQGCRFLVFGRRTNDRFESLSALNVPVDLKALCDEVSESEFRADVSSSELRKESSDDN